MSTPALEYRLGNDWVPELPPIRDADGSLFTGASVTHALTTSQDLGAPAIHGSLRRAGVEHPAGSATYVVRFYGRDLTRHLPPLLAQPGTQLYLVRTMGTRYRDVHRVLVRG